MMKYLPFMIFLCFVLPTHGQVLDTVLVKQEIDSMLAVNDSLFRAAQLDKAIVVLQEAEKKALDTWGDMDTLYAKCLINKGRAYGRKGQFFELEQNSLKAKHIIEHTVGTAHKDYTSVINNLAIAAFMLGDFENAEIYFLQAYAINKRLFEQKNAQYARVLNNLSVFYSQIGDYRRVEELSLEATQIIKEDLGEESPEYATMLSNLSRMYHNLKKTEKSSEYKEQALALKAKILGTEHIDYAESLKDKGSDYCNKGDYEKCEELWLECLRIMEKSGNKEVIFKIQVSLSILYYDLKKYQKAIAYFMSALQNKEEALGKKHAWYISNSNYLFDLYFKTGEIEKVKQLQLEMFKHQQFQIKNALSFLSESQKEKFFSQNIKPYINLLQSNTLRLPPSEHQNIQYDIALMMKDIQLQTSRKTLEYVFRLQDSTALRTYQDLLFIRRQLYYQYQRPSNQRMNLDSLISQKEQLEKQLTRLSSTFRQEQAAHTMTQKEVKAALELGEAAIEFVHFDYYHPQKTDSTMYAAIVLRPDQKRAQFIPLFEEKELLDVLAKEPNSRDDLPKDLYALEGKNAVKTAALSTQLYSLVWQALDSVLTDVKTIYYSPSGLLHRLNFAAIPIDKHQRLGEQYQLHQLSSTRKIALNKLELASFKEKNALVLGGITYDKAPITISSDSLLAAEIAAENLFQKFQRTISFNAETWSYLPGTAEEAIQVHQNLIQAGYDSQLWTDTTATETMIKKIGQQAASPRILHLATHGFYFPAPIDTLLAGDESIFKISTQPMIRSGLILSGANYAWSTGQTLPKEEDGILTAYEISQLNLSHTELVVLSACETGLGDIKGNEGVFGLQRAFKMAGVKYLIMSLWKVPDKATKELMTAFYDNWLNKEMDIPTAFRTAQQTMQERYKDATKWAGFVLVE